MYLVEILLPLKDNAGNEFGPEKFKALRDSLTKRFDGVTSFFRAPAHGTSVSGERIQHDDIVIMEVMTDFLEREWWSSLRKQLEADFSQDEVLIRASEITKL